MPTPDSVLIVRLSSMGDIIHTIPAYSALRGWLPHSRIDWLIDARFEAVGNMIEGLDNLVPWKASTVRTIRQLRSARYDLVIDFQGLMKSAMLARLSGSDRLIGFSRFRVRETPAALFYKQTHTPAGYGHVIFKNLSLVRALGIDNTEMSFPLKQSAPAPAEGTQGRFAVLVPGASWKHKQWPAESYGKLAIHLRERHGLQSVLTHGNPDELLLAERAALGSQGAAVVSPGIAVSGLLALVRGASLVVGGDTGPLHLAAAVGVPVVGLYGPTNPRRNGPWSGQDITVSRHEECQCKYRRWCSRSRSCILNIEPGEVVEAVDARLKGERTP